MPIDCDSPVKTSFSAKRHSSFPTHFVGGVKGARSLCQSSASNWPYGYKLFKYEDL